MKLSIWLKRGLILLLFLALLGGQSWATHRFFTSRFSGGNDFYARWANGCALIWTGDNPYSEEVTRQAQIGMHGRPAEPGEDLAAFSYPVYTLFFFWPLCFIRVYPVVQAIWMTLMLYVLLGGLTLTTKVASWTPPAWLWGVTLLWGVFNYPHARALILGQMATVVFFAFAASLWALKWNRDWLAGASLAVTTIKPQMSFLLIPWILWWAAWRRRWPIWKGFLLAMILLVGVSLLLVPTWIGDFVQGVRDYSQSWTRTPESADQVVEDQRHHKDSPNYGSLIWIVARHFLGLGQAAEVFGVAVLALCTLCVGWQERQAGWEGFFWTTGLVLILTNFVAPRTATTHYSMLALPLFAWFSRLKQQFGEGAGLAIVSIEGTLFIVQWGIFLTTIRGDFETPLVYLPYPVLMLAVQLVSRCHSHEVFS